MITGACLCGAVQLRVDDGGVKWSAYCHCTMCRRAHGTSPVAWVGVHRSQFHVDGPLAKYLSSSAAHRSFCAKCGSPLLFESERWADEVHIALGALNEPHAIVPRSQVFFDDRAAWAHVDDRLPKKGGPSGTTPLTSP